MLAACFPIETRWVRRSVGLRIVRVPMGRRAADGLPASLGGEDARLLISAGFSGGLSDAGRIGDIVLAESIDHAGTRITIDAELLQRVNVAVRSGDRRVAIGHTVCVDRVVSGVQEKRTLGQAGALAVDMESGLLARWAEMRGVPFLSVRVILDPVDRALPFSGDTSLWRSMLAHPVAAVQIGRMARAAGRALGAALNDLVEALEEAA